MSCRTDTNWEAEAYLALETMETRTRVRVGRKPRIFLPLAAFSRLNSHKDNLRDCR